MTPQETFTDADTPPAPRSALDAAKRLAVSLLTSKKIVTAVVGLIVLACARRGIVLQPDMVTEVVTIFAVLIGAQGLADTGKEKAKVETQAGAQIQSAFGWATAAKIGAGVAGGLLPGKAGQVAGKVGAALGDYDDDWTRRQIEKLAAISRENETRIERLEQKLEKKSAK